MSKCHEKQDDPFGPFNLSDFKKWMQGQQDTQPAKTNLVGLKVESRVPMKKLISRMDVQDGDGFEITKEFKKHGGIVSEADGSKILIELDAGAFIIDRMYVKKKN